MAEFNYHSEVIIDWQQRHANSRQLESI